MKNLGIILIALCCASPALADFGLRIGTGTSFIDMEEGDSDTEVSPFAIGAAWKMDIPLLSFEIDGLFWRNTFDDEGESTIDYLAVPAMAKVSIFGIPTLSLRVGAGLEPRFLISAETKDGVDLSEALEDTVWYVPVTFGADIDVQLISLGLEMRYERQVTDGNKDNSNRIHHLMLFAGAFF